MRLRDGRGLFTMTLPGPVTAPESGPTPVPTVVMEAGAAASRSSWGLVQPRVARFARAVVYDRSGLGKSPPDPAGRTLDRMADDLNDLLDDLAGQQPEQQPEQQPGQRSAPARFVLVGHSAGGPIVRLAASRRPERIAGLVLVDPTDEAAEMLFGMGFRRLERAAIVVGTALARLHLFRLPYRRLLAAMPPDVRADLAAEGFTPGVLRTQAAQARTFIDELSTWREHPPGLGDIPVTVISGTRSGDGLNDAARAAANASHAVRAAASPAGRHVPAPHSGHYVPVHDAELVGDEIRRLVELANGAAPAASGQAGR